MYSISHGWYRGVTAVVHHYNDVIMGAIAFLITSLTIVYSTVYSDADQRKHQSSASLAFVWGIHLGPVNSPHKWPVTQRMFTFDDVIMWMSIKPSSWGIAAPGIGAAITVLRNLQFISSNHAATCSCFHVNRWGVLSIWRGPYGTCPHVNGVSSKIMPFVTQLLFL